MDSWEFLPSWSEAEETSLFRQNKNLLSNLVPRVPSFYIRTKSRLKNRVTTVLLLQCKTKYFICLSFWGRNLHKLKNIHLGKPPVITKENFFWFVYTGLHSSTLLYSSRLVYNCLDLSSDSSTLVNICLDSSSNSSTFVCIRIMTPLLLSTFFCTRLDSSSDSSVFLEQIGSKCVYLEQERLFFFQMKIE